MMIPKNYILYLDDIRNPRDSFERMKEGIYLRNDWVVVRNYFSFCLTITGQWEIKNFPSLISFDHDLGKEHSDYFFENGGHENPPDPMKANFTEKTGYDCAKWLVDFCMDMNIALPKFKCHSHNPVGKENILGLLTNFSTQQTFKLSNFLFF